MVVHIGYLYGLNNTGGAAIASTRLHQALLRHGVNSHYVCVCADEAGENVHVLPHGAAHFVFRWLAKILRGVWKLTPYRQSIALHAVPLFGLETLLKEINPDVVHVQWLNADVMSFGQLGHLRMAFPNVRFVVNLHDLFMINAVEAHPGADRRYLDGFLKGDSTRLERYLFARKRRAIQALVAPVPGGRARPLAFIGPSEWVADCCRRSIIGKGAPAYAIPNLISPCFAHDASLRREHHEFVVLYGAFGGRQNRSKGFDDLARALALLPQDVKEDMELRIFGEEAEPCETEGVPTRFLGDVTSPSKLVSIYHKADVFAFPSIQETQGMTKVEAMLCGLPVVAFDRTACAEGIVPQETGSVAESIADFAKGLTFWHARWKDGAIDHSQIAAKARQANAEENILRKIKAVYSMTENCVVTAAAECRFAPPPGGGGYNSAQRISESSFFSAASCYQEAA